MIIPFGAVRSGGLGAIPLGLVVLLGGCELVLSEATPRPGEPCAAWQGGCLAVVDYREDGSVPRLRAETQLAGNVAEADRMPVPRCDTAPWLCQLQGGVDVLGERYFGRPSGR